MHYHLTQSLQSPHRQHGNATEHDTDPDSDRFVYCEAWLTYQYLVSFPFLIRCFMLLRMNVSISVLLLRCKPEDILYHLTKFFWSQNHPASTHPRHLHGVVANPVPERTLSCIELYRQDHRSVALVSLFFSYDDNSLSIQRRLCCQAILPHRTTLRGMTGCGVVASAASC